MTTIMSKDDFEASASGTVFQMAVIQHVEDNKSTMCPLDAIRLGVVLTYCPTILSGVFNVVIGLDPCGPAREKEIKFVYSSLHGILGSTAIKVTMEGMYADLKQWNDELVEKLAEDEDFYIWERIV